MIQHDSNIFNPTSSSLKAQQDRNQLGVVSHSRNRCEFLCYKISITLTWSDRSMMVHVLECQWNITSRTRLGSFLPFCRSWSWPDFGGLECWNESMFVDIEGLETQIGYNLITSGLLDRWLRRQIMRNASHSQRSALLDSSPLEQKLWKMKKSWMKNPSDFYIEVLVACTLDANVMPKLGDEELQYWCQFDS